MLAKCNLKRMNAEAHVDKLQNNGPDRLDIFELLVFAPVALGKEMRELARVELNGEAVQILWRRTSFVCRWFRIGHGGYLSL